MVVILTICLISMSGRVCAQPTNIFPMTGYAGIGILSPQNALHLNFSSSSGSDSAIIRLSNSAPSSSVFGILGLMPASCQTYSSISTGEDLILHEHSQGDIILTNYQSTSLSHPYGAIRFATTPGSFEVPSVSPPPYDVERMTIMPNGNVGIDLPPETTGISAGLDTALDQLQIGGGVLPPVGYSVAMPGLTIYGGNRFEGLAKAGGDFFPVDWRYIAFNQYTDHSDSSATRSRRIALMSSSVIAFAANDVTNDGGMIDLHCMPYTSSTGLNDDTAYGINLHLMGSKGLQL
jgi:hypothetical protein